MKALLDLTTDIWDLRVSRKYWLTPLIITLEPMLDLLIFT